VSYLKNLANEQDTRTLQLVEAIARRLSLPHARSRDSRERTLELVERIARRAGLLPSIQEPAPMGTVIKSIGTSGRDYSTITLWEADLDNGAVYASGDIAIGECYNDSAFDESFTINGGGTVGLANVILRAAAGNEHDGTAGSGARVVCSASRGFRSTTADVVCLEIDFNGHGDSENGAFINSGRTYSRLLLHGQRHNSALNNFGLAGGRKVLNCIVYDISTSATFGTRAAGIEWDDNAFSSNAATYNCTVYNVTAPHASATGFGIRMANQQATNNNRVANCIAVGCEVDFQFSNVAHDHLISSDSTAGGTGSSTGVSASSLFVSTVSGSEDLHLKSGASAINAGADLGTTPTGVNIDINGRDRDAEGDVWDIGAHEYVAVGSYVDSTWHYLNCILGGVL
jgi:hypothetical protein